MVCLLAGQRIIYIIMLDLKQLQQQIYANKVAKGFNTTDIAQEFCMLHEELSEAYRAYYNNLPDLSEELADVAIYLLGLAQIMQVDLETEILRKVEINQQRQYTRINGVMVKEDQAAGGS